MQDGTALVSLLTDSAVFGPFVGGESWAAWRAFMSAVFGVTSVDPSEADLIRTHTGRSILPDTPAREVWCVVGRRGGKSRIAAILAVLLSAFRDYSAYLTVGERATLMVIAADRKQARVVFKYISALFDALPMLAVLIESRTAEAIHLTNRVSIEVHTCSFRSVRGYTLIGVIADEVAYWSSDEAGANPDSEVLNSLRPALATIPGALLIGISSPYARKGELWKSYQQHHGHDGDRVLVWQAASEAMNPLLDRAIVAQAYQDDPASAAAEYGAEFRRDLEAFVSREVVERAVVPDRVELPPMRGVIYRGFIDPSGGSSDSMTMAIAHMDRGRTIVDLVLERTAPFDPNAVTEECAGVLTRYRIRTVHGDRYAAEWPVERFRAHGITYRTAERNKSELYGELLPLLNAGGVELLDVPRLRSQLLALERRTTRVGRDTIDHPPRQRDDVINAVAGVIVQVNQPPAAPLVVFVGAPATDPASRVMEMRRQQKSEALAQQLEDSQQELTRRRADGRHEVWVPY